VVETGSEKEGGGEGGRGVEEEEEGQEELHLN